MRPSLRVLGIRTRWDGGYYIAELAAARVERGVEFANGAKGTGKSMAPAKGLGRGTWVHGVGMEGTEVTIIEYLPGSWSRDAKIVCPADPDPHRHGLQAPHHRQGTDRPGTSGPDGRGLWLLAHPHQPGRLHRGETRRSRVLVRALDRHRSAEQERQTWHRAGAPAPAMRCVDVGGAPRLRGKLLEPGNHRPGFRPRPRPQDRGPAPAGTDPHAGPDHPPRRWDPAAHATGATAARHCPSGVSATAGPCRSYPPPADAAGAVPPP